MKCIEDEIPFEVPEGWEWSRLNCVVDVRDGTHDTPTYVDKGVPLITSKNLVEGGIDYSNVKYISEKDALSINERSGVNIGDILFAMIGTIGNPSMVTEDILISIKNVALFKFSFSNNLSKHFIMYYLDCAQDDMKKKTSGGLQPFVSLNFLRTYLVPIPPVEEQHRIVSFLIDSISCIRNIDISKSDFAILIERTKSQILELAIRGKLVPQDPNDEPASVLLERIRAEKEELIKQGKIKRDKKESIIFRGDDNSYYEKIGDDVRCIDEEIPFDIPDDWEWIRLKNVCNKIIDGSHNPPKGMDNLTPFIMASSRNINFDTLLDLENVRYLCQRDYEIENARTNIKTGDILLTTVATLGRSCIYNGFPKNLCFQRSVTVISTDILPEYLKLFFDAPYFQKFIFNNATGTAQKGFYLNQLENVLVCVPPLGEQTRMAQTAGVILKQLLSIEKSLN